jgi:tetratricopeptide (TPR) repeat protein
MKKVLFTLFFGLLMSKGAFSAPVNMWFEKANSFYSEQKYDSAAHYYEKIIESGFESSTVYFNCGNAWYRLKKPGLARLYYEKASLLDPFDEDIRSNIRFLKSNIVDRIPEPEQSFMGMIFNRVHHLFSLSIQIWIFLGLLLLISIFASALLFVKNNGKLWLIYGTILLSIITIAIGTSAGMKVYEKENVAFAVLLASSSDAKNEPDGSKILFTAHEGIKFRIRKSEDKWSLVSLPNGVSGWVRNSDLGKI